MLKLANMVLGPWLAKPHHVRRVPPRQHPNVAIISAVPPNPCRLAAPLECSRTPLSLWH
jgi:hypothetical protein